MSFPSNDPNNTNHVVTSYNIPFPHYPPPPPPNSSFLFSPAATTTANHHQMVGSTTASGGGGGQASAPLICCPKRLTPVRGDRHSKIRTAQGLRDRRVRLSIGIARKFFDLQDLLGFDKASKTLDWLLGQSETAIHELEKTKNPPAVKVSLNMEEEEEMGGQQRRREMARARARERTREKKINKMVTSEEDEEEEFDPGHHFGQIGSSDPKFATPHEKGHDLITTSKDHDIVISPNSPLLISWDLGTAFSQNQAFLL